MLPLFFVFAMYFAERFNLAVDRPLVMGIVNLTPDSFSGDGIAANVDKAVAHAFWQISQGADLLDIGAESSRPGAQPTSLQDELQRLLPVLHALRNCGVPLSVDTYKPEVMQAAVASGAHMINDIYGFRMPGAFAAVVDSDCSLCIMHMQGEPLHMQQSPDYRDVVGEVRDFLAERVVAAGAAGIAKERIVLDPGFGFGKSLQHNLQLLKNLSAIDQSGLPILAGLSRKSMLGQIVGRDVDDRLPSSIAAALLAGQYGARIIRVHDVAATRDALAVWQAVEESGKDGNG